MTIFASCRVLLLAGACLICAGVSHAGEASPVVTATTEWTLPSGNLPLGDAALLEQRSRTEIAPGVTHFRVLRGHASLEDGFEAEAGLAMDDAGAKALEETVVRAGFKSKRVPAARPALQPDNTGIWIRVDDRFTSLEQAETVVEALKAQGLGKARRRYTAEDGLATTGPWAINILAIGPGFGGQLRAELANGVIPGKEGTGELSQRLNALAAINAGFFVVKGTSGTEGDLAGLSVIDGRLVSEGTEGRPGFFFGVEGGKRVAYLKQEISTVVSLQPEGAEAKRIDGLNRKPGMTFSCGNPFDAETAVALHDVTCTDPNEIVAFTQDFGGKSDAGGGVEVELDGDGTVTRIAETRGGAIPREGALVQGIGTGADWLKANVQAGRKLILTHRLVDGAGQEIKLEKGIYAVNGGPTLLSGGKDVPYAQIVKEGFGIADVASVPSDYSNADRAYFVNDWFIRRNPHAAIGIAEDGTLLLVTVDGRAPRYSAGLSVTEVAGLMRFLGAKDAMKLDGGGSTMMVVKGKPQNVPSDATGERPDGDAIVVMP